MYKFNFYHSREENFFSNDNPRETSGLVGHLRGDFGKSGDEFWHTWFDSNEKLNSKEFKEDFDKTMKVFREVVLADRNWMRSIAYNNPKTKLSMGISESYGMFAETDNYEYDIRFITENGDYDFYIYCYDKRFQEPQFLNARRFRDENGIVNQYTPYIAKTTKQEAASYYIDGDRYEYNGEVYTFYKYDDKMEFKSADGKTIEVEPKNLGTFLPDVASEGISFARIPLIQMLSELTLGDLLKSTTLKDVHLVHPEEEIELATVVELKGEMFTEEGRKEWADVLNARVSMIYEGAYGLQIACRDVEPQKLKDFSYMLAGYCPAKEYDRWIKPDMEQEQNMNM